MLGMKVTNLKQQVKNPNRVSVFVDGKYSFSLSLDEVVKYKIINEQDITKNDEKKFKKISEDGKLRARSLEWLLNRPHSTREFKDYLYRKKADAELLESLVREFTEKGYLDDVKFAEWFIDLQARRNKSRRAIRAELLKKGVSGEQLEEVLAKNDIDETRALVELVAKKQKLSRYKNDSQKLKQYLVRQGFSYEMINRILKK